MHLLRFELRIDAGTPRSRTGLVGDVTVDADHDRVRRVDRQLCLVRRVLHLPLDVALLDCRQRAADRLDPREQLARAFLDLVGQFLDVIRRRQTDRPCWPRPTRSR